MRSQRENNQLRNIIVTKNFMKNAFSSCLIEFGNTKVICSVSIEYRVPRWLKGSGKGWLTAEYSMLPTSTNTRNERMKEILIKANYLVEVKKFRD